MAQPVMGVLQSLHYFNSYGPLTSFINFISWCGVFQMATASSWNAGLDVKIQSWYMERRKNTTEEEEDCTT